MATEIKLPDLGEGALDATISRWRVQEGDQVSIGDILLEVATDKVDTEVPSPVAGKVLKINFSEGALVDMNAVIAVVGAVGDAAGEVVAEVVGGAPATPAAVQAAESKPTESRPTESAPAVAETPAPAQSSENGQGVKVSPVAKRVAADKGVALDAVAGTGPGGRITKGDVLASADKAVMEALPGAYAEAASLPVARLAAEYNIDLAAIAAGRPLSTLTRYDVLSAAASRDAGKAVAVDARFVPPRAVPGVGEAAPAAQPAAKPADAKAPAAQPAAPAEAKPQPAAKPAATPVQLGAGEELIKHTRMRTAIARTTTASLFTAPHVTTMWDVNMSAVMAHRKAHKDAFAAQGVNLTITAYFVEAVLAGLRAVPAANATYTDEGVIIKRAYNIGMAVALPVDQHGLGGLIVPVIKNAGELNLLGLARAVNEMADKARKNQLKADDLTDGTFTISNYGTSGSRFQTPIIVQPQVGILGVGAIEKRAVVVSQGHPLEANTGDYLAFLPMTTLGFSYDHRVLDGATADAFCGAVKKTLESY